MDRTKAIQVPISNNVTAYVFGVTDEKEAKRIAREAMKK